MKAFDDPKEALKYLLEEAWDNLNSEQKIKYKNVKANLKNEKITLDKIEETLVEMGAIIKKVIVIGE